MAIDLSSIGFPHYITGVKTGDGSYFKGGYNYQTQHNGWTSVNIVKYHKRFNGVMHIQPDGASYKSDWITYYTAPNGYKFQFYIQQIQDGEGSPNGWVSYSTRVMNEDETEELPHNAITYFHPNAANNQLVPLMNWGNAVFDFYLSTWYYPTVDPPDDTPCSKLQFNVAAGLINAPNPYNFHDGLLYGNEIYPMFSGDLAYWEATATALSGYDAYMHQHGRSYTGDSFTTDSLPDGPAGSDDTSHTGGGEGNYDDTSDPIDFPDLPTGGALECGAVIAHRVSKQTIEAIFSKLWSNSIFDPTTMWQKSLQNPMDAIVSLHALPFSPEVDGSTAIEIGNFDTELTSPEVTSQYVAIDCGEKNVSEYWGSALDYSPYTRAEIYLPFIGVKDIAVEDIMDSTMHIKYYIDVLTGECIAFIKCGLSVLYHFKGNCKMAIPLSSATMDLIQNTLGAMGHIVSSAAMGAAVGGGAGALAGTVMSAAANVASTKIRTSKSDDMSGASSLMDDYVPYLILHRPIQSLARDYNKFKGYPSNITANLGNLSGYTEVEHINLQNIPNATEAEMVEIKSLLKQGVLL